MLKNKKLLSILGIVLSVVILFCIFGTPKYQSMKLKNNSFINFENKLKEEVNKNTEIDLKKLADFDFDECYVFTPYYPPKAIYKKVGAEWTTAKTFIGYLLFHSGENQTANDNQFVIVFKKDNKVILSSVYSLKQLPVIFKLDDYKFTASNSKFKVATSKQYNEGKVKELVPQK